MKPVFLPVFVLMLLITSLNVQSQGISCDSFCVTNVRFDTAFNGQMIISVHFSGDDEDFINYPHVSLVTNLNGDTLGTGTLSLFGQIGNTTSDFAVDTELQDIPDGFAAIVHFRYDDTLCILQYPCMTTGINEIAEIEISISPNPVSSKAIISLDESFDSGSIQLYNLQGILFKEIKFFQTAEIELEVDDLANGMYIMLVKRGEQLSIAKVMVEN